MIESTFIMLKPDTLKRGLAGEIISRIERKSYKITNVKMMSLDEKILTEHYSHIVDKPFFPGLLDYMMSGPVLAMVVEGENAICGMRTIIGATNFEDAIAGTIRGDFAYCTSHNLIHGSDSLKSAQVEIERFFG
jgi:nucleoside-diphosphate kinase